MAIAGLSVGLSSLAIAGAAVLTAGELMPGWGGLAVAVSLIAAGFGFLFGADI